MKESSLSFHSVRQLVVKRGNTSFISSCVFISPTVAITAAHCVDDASLIEVDGHAAIQCHIHPEYDKNKSNYLNDIAVLKFTESFPYSKISFQHLKLAGEKFHRAGYGFRNNTNVQKSYEVYYLKNTSSKVMNCYDPASAIGDSGGGVFNSGQELVGIHSTKENDETYVIDLSGYHSWVIPYINKYDLPVHQNRLTYL